MAAKHRSGMVNPCRNASSLCWPIGSCVLGASTAWPPGWKIFTCQSLDDLQAEKKQVEKAVYLELRNLFSLQPDLVFYDITSTYFEGAGPAQLGRFGFSRDDKPRNRQIVIDVVMMEGWPIAHHVFAGNHLDQTTCAQSRAE